MGILIGEGKSAQGGEGEVLGAARDPEEPIGATVCNFGFFASLTNDVHISGGEGVGGEGMVDDRF